MFPILLLMGIALAVFGCADPNPQVSEPDPDAGLRIASLSPALSRVLVDLDLESLIVGRSTFCDFLDPTVPVVGDLQQVNYERLLELKPTHILVQTSAAGVDPMLATLADEHGWHVAQWTALNTLEDIKTLMREMPGQLAPPGPARDRMTARVEALLEELASILSPPLPGAGVGVGVGVGVGPMLLVHHAREPVGVFGAGTYLSDIIVKLGGSNVVDGHGWTTLSLEDIVRLDPPAIMLIHGTALDDRDVHELLGPLAQLELRAVRDGRVLVLDDPEAMRPSSGIIPVAKRVRSLLEDLHREAVDTP